LVFKFEGCVINLSGGLLPWCGVDDVALQDGSWRSGMGGIEERKGTGNMRLEPTERLVAGGESGVARHRREVAMVVVLRRSYSHVVTCVAWTAKGLGGIWVIAPFRLTNPQIVRPNRLFTPTPWYGNQTSRVQQACTVDGFDGY
jgi:hypothetical protein